MKDAKKYIALLLSMIITVSLFAGFYGAPYAGAANDQQKIDVMLVVDASTSMNSSDKQKVANEAMKMFVDMTSEQGDKIGVMAYTDQIVREKALLKIEGPEDKGELKRFIDQVARGPYTDIAVGVAESVKVLERSGEPDHSPMIVLLADGNNSLPKERTQEQSDKELQAAVSQAKAAGIPIYTIGLNADGKLNKQVLQGLSDDTGGKAFVTSSADDLPRILSEIFADHLKLKVIPLTALTGNGQFQEVTVSIPNGNVIEGNISIISGKPVEVKLVDPAGKERPVPSDGVLYSTSNAYSLIKLLKPEQGDWKLQVKGASKDKIDINLVFNYDLQLAVKPVAGPFKKGDKVDIEAQLESNGQALGDPDLYKGMTSRLVVTDIDAGTTTESPMTNGGSLFSGTFEIPESRNYELVVRVEDNSFFRESEPVQINAGGGAAKPSSTPPATSGQVPASEKEGLNWPLVIGGLVLLILLAVAAWYVLALVKRSNKGFYGQFIIEIHDEDTGERTSPQYKKLSGFKGKLKLHQLLQLAPEFAETDKILFRPGKDSVFIVNQSGCLIEKSGRAFDAAKGKELKNNDRIKISLQAVHKSIILDYIN